jgi:exopolysaccharide biosynthesis polyprenyl glycosylphosphotransferase
MPHSTGHTELPEIKTMAARTPLVILVLLIGDTLSFLIAFILATSIRFALIPVMGGSINWQVFLPLLYTNLFSLLIIYSLTGLYPGFGRTAVEEMRQIFYSLLLGYGVLGLAFYLQKVAPNFSRSVFVMGWAFAFLINLTVRVIIRNRASLLSWWGVPVIIIGHSVESHDVIQRLLRSRRLGLKPVLLLDESANFSTAGDLNSSGEETHTKPSTIQGVPVINSREQMVEIATRHKINYAVFIEPLKDSPTMRSPLSARSQENQGIEHKNHDEDFRSQLDLRWLSKFFPTVLVVLASSELGSLWVRTVDLEGRLTLQASYHLLNKQAIILKRAFDLILGVSFTILCIPLFLLIALLIKLDSRGSIIYTQERIGRDGKLIKYLKFRTMQINAEQRLDELLAKNPQAREEYDTYHKLAQDPRVTRVGKLLRKFSLDELPQLFHVIMGDLSLVGPRAYMFSECPDMGDYQNLILQVQPGMTGWWQVMGRQTTTFQQRLQLDEYYLSNWSLWLDIYILLKTGWVVIKGIGA